MTFGTAVDGNRRKASAGVSDPTVAWLRGQGLYLPNVAAIPVRY